MQVLREETTGALDMDFLHSDFTNAYLNVSNIVLKIVPVDASSNQTVLVNAHFDSTLGSPGKAVPLSYASCSSACGYCALQCCDAAIRQINLPGAGASDCAGCVGVALELARLLVADRSRRPQVPMTFLLNGGEEAFLLGAHAFREHSRYRKDLAVAVNL